MGYPSHEARWDSQRARQCVVCVVVCVRVYMYACVPECLCVRMCICVCVCVCVCVNSVAETHYMARTKASCQILRCVSTV